MIVVVAVVLAVAVTACWLHHRQHIEQHEPATLTRLRVRQLDDVVEHQGVTDPRPRP